MAQGGAPGHFFNIPVHISISASTKETTVVGDQHYGDDVTNITNIRDSNIGAVGGEIPQDQVHPEQHVENDGPQIGVVNAVEEVQEPNIDSCSDVKRKKSFLRGLSKVFNKNSKKKFSVSEASFPNATTGQLSPISESKSCGGFQMGIIRELSAAYMWRKQPDYSKACELLEELSAMQQKSDFDNKLQLLECYLYLDMEEKCNQAMDDIFNVIEAEKIETDKVFTLAVTLLESSAYIRALLLFAIAYTLYIQDNLSPDDLVNKHFNIAQQIHIAVKALIKVGGRSKFIAIGWGIYIMKKTYLDSISVEKCDLASRDIKRAQILDWIGSSYRAAGQIEESLVQRNEAVELLETRFRIDASKHHIYGRLLNNIGLIYIGQGRLTKAKEYLTKSIECYKKANDFKSKNDKTEAIKIAENELGKVRDALRKK